MIQILEGIKEEKVDLGNLGLFPPDNKMSNYISDKEILKSIRLAGHENEKAPSESSKNSYEICQICELEFRNKVVLKVHNLTVHPEINEAKFSIEETPIGNEICQICGVEFINKVVLKVHNLTVHPDVNEANFRIEEDKPSVSKFISDKADTEKEIVGLPL